MSASGCLLGPDLAGPAPGLRRLVYSWVVTALTSV